MKLKDLKIVGFTTGNSICANCGTGIRNLVLVVDAEGVTHHIGTDCATRVGLDPEQIKYRMTDAQRDEKLRKEEERRVRDAERQEIYRAKLKVRYHQVMQISEPLRSLGGEFYTSLADQLEAGTISSKQAYYAVKAVLGRRTKKNEDLYDFSLWICTNFDS